MTVRASSLTFLENTCLAKKRAVANVQARLSRLSDFLMIRPLLALNSLLAHNVCDIMFIGKKDVRSFIDTSASSSTKIFGLLTRIAPSHLPCALVSLDSPNFTSTILVLNNSHSFRACEQET